MQTQPALSAQGAAVALRNSHSAEGFGHPGHWGAAWALRCQAGRCLCTQLHGEIPEAAAHSTENGIWTE